MKIYITRYETTARKSRTSSGVFDIFTETSETFRLRGQCDQNVEHIE